MSSLADIRRALSDGPLARRFDDLEDLAEPSIVLRPTRVRQVDLSTGESRIGGVPDLPGGIEWPRWKGEPQSFIAQIRLSSLGELSGLYVPPTGWLLFFYSARQDTWGFSPADRGSSAVMYVPETAKLERTAPPEPLPDGGAFEPCRVSFAESWTLPSWDSPLIESLGLTDEELDAYCDAVDALFHGDRHRLLGHPDQIQGDMTVECALVTGGLDLGDASGRSDPRAAELAEGWSDWRLLLQVVSDDAPGMMWGDAGHLYYWIRAPDLEAGDFNRIWLILQCF